MRWPWMRRACLMGALLPVLGAPLPGHAQVESREGIALQNQIYQLRQDLQILHSDIARGGGYGGGGGGGGGDIAAQLLARVQAMEEQLRQLRGRIDETQNQVTRQTADLSKRIDDLTFQLNLPGKSGSASPPGYPGGGSPVPAPPPVREVMPRPAPPPQDSSRAADMTSRPDLAPQTVMPAPLPSVIPPPPPAPPRGFTFNQTPEPMREGPPPQQRIDPARPVPRPTEVARPRPPADEAPPAPTDVSAAIPTDGKRTPEMALQEGHAALARRDYAAAERAAREVMANRTSPRAYDGQFLLAQALSGEKQYAQAAIAFDDAYNRSHKGRHAQDAMLGLAAALTAINEKKAACDTLGRMKTEFPQVRADLQEAITRTNERAGCGR
jgi:TolA-binding protein